MVVPEMTPPAVNLTTHVWDPATLGAWGFSVVDPLAAAWFGMFLGFVRWFVDAQMDTIIPNIGKGNIQCCSGKVERLILVLS